MKRLVLALAVVVILVAAPSEGGVVGSKHDLSTYTSTGRVCVFCHTPHQPNLPTFIDQDPLWNHTLSTAGAYGVYASLTLNANPQEISGTTSWSLLCMSCHDGTVGIGSLYNDPNFGTGEETPSNSGTLMSGNANLGTDLTNDHPINFTYSVAATEDDDINAATPTITDWLVGGMMQCSSCHDPHDDQFLPFLNADNDASGLCTTCHAK